jgi:hypothetical protein
MAVFVELQEDPFNEAFNDEKATAQSADLRIRRPTRGFQLREDKPAYLTIIDRYGEPYPPNGLVDAAGAEDDQGIGHSVRYTNFMVTQFSSPRAEKQQIVQTFGEDFVFFFGEQPRIGTIQGYLLHTADFNWRNEFMHNYENYLRGTKLVEANARAYIFQAGVLWEGYALGFNVQQASQQPNHVMFELQFLITNETIVDNVGDVSFPILHGGMGSLDNPWAFTVLLKTFEQNRRTLPQRWNFAQDLSNFILGADTQQDFSRTVPLRGKISDNLDEFIGGSLKASFSPIELAKARRKMGIRRAIYLVREMYLRSKFVMDSARRLTVGEQTTLAKTYGVRFVISSLADAGLPG